MELRNTHREFNRETRPNLFYPIYINPKTKETSLEKNDGFEVECYPLWNDGFEGCWTWGKDLAEKDNNLLVGKKQKSGWKVYRKSYAQLKGGPKAEKKLFTILNDSSFYTEKGQSSFGNIFPGLNKNDFPQPKSVDYVKELINTITTKDSIVLDSFAGSGTTAQAVLNLNYEDGGNRKFILIEMEDYANDITSERIKRVSKGYGEEKNAAPGTGGEFDFYELGMTLFDENQNLNEEVDIKKIREFIWYSETRTAFPVSRDNSESNFLLGEKDGTSYYFIYKPNELTTLDYDALNVIEKKSEQYIVYADNCLLPKEFMVKHNIIFKKKYLETSQDFKHGIKKLPAKRNRQP